MSNIYEKLENLQHEFKAPKSEWNDHGKFKYRTLEKMLEVLKPLLKKQKVLLLLSDDLQECAETPHVVATATLINLDDVSEKITIKASAQEAAIQKGMQAAQISGSTSSYARKYALSALLLVDDTDEIDNKEGDQNDWDTEIKASKDIKGLMKIFTRMDSNTKKAYTDKLTERKRELTEEVIDGNSDKS